MSQADTPDSGVTVRAVAAPYGQAWRIDPEGAGGEVGHIGTRLTLQADADARGHAREAEGWARFMALANARNLELAARKPEEGR